MQRWLNSRLTTLPLKALSDQVYHNESFSIPISEQFLSTLSFVKSTIVWRRRRESEYNADTEYKCLKETSREIVCKKLSQLLKHDSLATLGDLFFYIVA